MKDFWSQELTSFFDQYRKVGYEQYPAQYQAWQKFLNFQAQDGASEAKDPRRQDLFEQPATAHYHDHNFDPWPHPGDGQAYTVELARFPVPHGSIGIVRKINQWVSGDFTISNHWGNPFTGTDVDDYIWSLRLVPFDGTQAARWIDTSPVFPGRPYPDLPQWQYLLFLPHASGSDVNLVVPGGNILQLLCRTTALQERDEIWGRLVGYWQRSEYAIESSYNVKKGF